MFKRIMSAVLVALMVFSLSACGKGEGAQNDSTPPASTDANLAAVANPLTGMLDFSADKANARPVAVMIDNDSVAQNNAQFGVSAADIVYETEVEGGITRLMVVFADASKIPQLGDIRSARYVFTDLAKGHNAIYVHHGMDPVYCKQHIKEIGLDNFTVSTSNDIGWRKTYGASTNWQNLYTTGERLVKGFAASNWVTTQDEFKAWQNFVAETPALAGGAANKIDVGFSGATTAYFTYDSATGKYNKTSAQCQNIDKGNSAPYAFTNVFVLQTAMSYYSDNYHRQIDLESGTGYYAVGGTYEKIKWSKGAADKPFVFTKEDGTPLNVKAGNSWVCIAKTDSNISFN